MLLVLAACQQVATDLTAPGVPTGLSAVAGDTVVNLSWTANSEGDLDHYNVYRGTTSGSLTKVDEVPAGTTTFTDPGLTNGTTYIYAISAEDASGNESAQTAEVSATPTASVLETCEVGTSTVGNCKVAP